MRLFKSVLVGALACSVGLLSAAGCSDDDPDPVTPGGTGGGGAGGSSGAGTGGGGTGGGGTGGGGAGGSSGTSGGDASACTPTDANKAECKARGGDSGTCTALVECSCNNCVCELDACENNPGCRAIRQCATRTGCCSPVDTACVATGKPTCSDAMHECGILISEAGAADPQSTALISAVSVCVYGPPANCTNTVCDSGGDAATDAGGGG